MKSNFVKYFSFLAVFGLFYSCVSTEDTVTTSSNAAFVSLTFTANDSTPNIEDAVFSLQANNVIVNLDSLPYGTKISKVINPTFSFKSSYSIKVGDKYISGTDTIDFTNPLLVVNMATDQETTQSYTVKVNVHKVQPELYVWDSIRGNITSDNILSQKAIAFKGNVLYFVSKANVTELYNLQNGKSLTAGGVVTGLPVGVNLSDMVVFNDKLYLTQNSALIYSSQDGVTWQSTVASGLTFKSLLVSFNSKLLALVKSNSNGSNYFAGSATGLFDANSMTTLAPANFPENQFSAVAFNSRVNTPKAYVLGGKNTNNGLLTSWGTDNGTDWYEFGKENNSLDSVAVGASVIAYDQKMLMLGKSVNGFSAYLESVDEGLTWKKPSKSYNVLPKGLTKRVNASFFVLKPLEVTGVQPDASLSTLLESNHIFIIGGTSSTGTLSDVWGVKLNRKSFLRQ